MVVTLEEALAASEKTNAELAAGGAKAREEYNARHSKARTIRSLKAKSLMDSKCSVATFDNFCVTKKNEAAFRLSQKYVNRFDEMQIKNQGLLFYGSVGTGKTFMAACIANALLNKAIAVVMTSFVKILQNVQSFDDVTSEMKIMQALNRAKLLVLDDLGAERTTDYALEKVYNIVDSRYRAGKPMILTTNLSLAQMQAATDVRYARIYDRIFEVCYPVEFKGKSWRQKAAANRFDEMTDFFGGQNEN